MWKVIVKHRDLTTEKTLTVTTNKDCKFIQKLTHDYQKRGFVVRFENISDLAYLD